MIVTVPLQQQPRVTASVAYSRSQIQKCNRFDLLRQVTGSLFSQKAPQNSVHLNSATRVSCGQRKGSIVRLKSYEMDC